MQYWAIQTLNSLALGGLLFLLAAGFSLIFGLMRIANLTHGALFMLGAYVGVSILKVVPNLWLAALLGGARGRRSSAGCSRRFILRKLGGNVLGQVLVTLGVAFIIADLCLIVWGGDPIPIADAAVRCSSRCVVGGARVPGLPAGGGGRSRSSPRSACIVLMERTRLGAMIRAGVDDMEMARAVGIPVSRLFTTVFCLGAALAGAGGVHRRADHVGLSRASTPTCCRSR